MNTIRFQEYAATKTLRRPFIRLTDEQWSYVKKAQRVAASRKLEVQADGQKLLENIAEAKRRYGEKLTNMQGDGSVDRNSPPPHLKEIGRSESFTDVTLGCEEMVHCP
ncbi:hypothetical protein GUITHDRAFT_103312 [Guillardia theta CCMP2712]|uniref:Uncharacterized protein n=2 Tax=Guillardia theta TaxID=55529 RepID=L1JQ60_GUITC|nr:hypothetical protein GUITHDRAFT_103312 [Guillardia theta CCMP2712]EKX50721.1 hypothetical protein GUITHDRAFT_103312 [Guillardia theta CCMP2712]|eukprot:XP_005837701.1 hypothetical protein GUITHDRAFT_103312 [Guillardia theta CCMP2712]